MSEKKRRRDVNSAGSKMAAAVEKQLSTASEDFEDGSLDPRVQHVNKFRQFFQWIGFHPFTVELEKLNKSSEDINTLEVELDEARASFRQSLTESTQRLNALSKKLGRCIEKARPYYDARMRAKEAQIQTQNVALRFERACSQQMAAKEMVFLAEQGFFKKGQPFDPAWQEMLNHATIKVNDAERERLESEIAHQVTAHIFNECEQHVKQLEKELKRNITKSRPYFEQKAKFNQTMEDQKRRVGMLEQAVADAKMMYSDALKSLESISDEIHQQRRDARLRKEMGTRGAGVGAEEPNPISRDGEGPGSTHGHVTVKHGHMTVNRTNSQTQTGVGEMLDENSDPTQGNQVVGTVMAASNRAMNYDDVFTAAASNLVRDAKGQVVSNGDTSTRVKCETGSAKPVLAASAKPVQVDSHAQSVAGVIKAPPVEEPIATTVCGVTTSATPASLFKQPLPVGDNKERQHLTVGAAADDTETISETVSSIDVLSPGSGPSSVQTTAVTSPETEHSPEAHVESTRTNMEIMETLQKAKNFKSPFLRPNRSRDDLLDDAASDNESIPGSMASVSVLGDDQIESLMLETGDFVSFLARQDDSEVDKIKSMTLPAKLSYLQNYMSFKPEFIEVQNDKPESVHQNKNDCQIDSADCEENLKASGGDELKGLVTESGPQQLKLLIGDDAMANVKNSEDPERKHSSQQELVIDNAEFDACWSCEINMDDLPHKRGDVEATQACADLTHFAPVADNAPVSATAPISVSRRYSFEEDSELQRVYKELSAFEKLMRSSSSESPPPLSPPLLAQQVRGGSEERRHLEIVSENQVQITFTTAAESLSECQKDPLGVMPIRAIASIGPRVGGVGEGTSAEVTDGSLSEPVERNEADSATQAKASPSANVDKVEHFV